MRGTVPDIGSILYLRRRDQRMPWPFRSYDLFRPIIIEIVPVNQAVTLEPVALAVFRGTRV